MSKRLESLRQQHNDITTGIDEIEKRAVDNNRDLTDAEQAEVDALYARSETLLPEIEAEGKKVGTIQAAASVLAKIAPSSVVRRSVDNGGGAAALVLPSAGEFYSLLLRAKQGDTEASELITRAVATMSTADTAGILPKPILGPVIKLADDERPVFRSFTPRPMPAQGKTFSRPTVTQRVLVGEQAAEFDEAASRKMTITGTDVDKRTFAGALEISEQDVDWTDPAVLQLAIDDFAGYYGMVTEGAACTYLEALAVDSPTWTATDIGTIVASITAGIQTVYTAAKRMPNVMYLSLDEMLSIAGMTNADDSVTAFTLIKQTLADAGVPMSFVTGPQLSANTRILGCSSLIESYENQKGLLSAPDISHLGVTIAYRGYVAFYGKAAGFAQLTDAP